MFSFYLTPFIDNIVTVRHYPPLPSNQELLVTMRFLQPALRRGRRSEVGDQIQKSPDNKRRENTDNTDLAAFKGGMGATNAVTSRAGSSAPPETATDTLLNNTKPLC